MTPQQVAARVQDHRNREAQGLAAQVAALMAGPALPKPTPEPSRLTRAKPERAPKPTKPRGPLVIDLRRRSVVDPRDRLLRAIDAALAATEPSNMIERNH